MGPASKTQIQNMTAQLSTSLTCTISLLEHIIPQQMTQIPSMLPSFFFCTMPFAFCILKKIAHFEWEFQFQLPSVMAPSKFDLASNFTLKMITTSYNRKVFI